MLKTATSSASSLDISKWTWDEKYRYYKDDGTTDEHTISDTHKRVINGVYAKDKKKNKHAPLALKMMEDYIWCPAGRIHSGMGTKKRVTSINCYVAPTIQDSMDTIKNQEGLGILDSYKVAMLTQQMGGGIGMDFSTLRPEGALVKRTHSISTGPLPFMEMWDAGCACVKSSGSRRGAMMGTLRIDHPDIKKFITYKQTAGKLTNFNVSVLVTTKFMDAVANDEDFDLIFNVPRADSNHVGQYTDKSGQIIYIYDRIRARDLWDMIIKNTFEYAEPGVLFIDDYNNRNNLYYCETIASCNPCGEQGLPPNGACNLGAVNLAKLVDSPFTDNAFIKFDQLKKAVQVGTRFLDNVLDVSLFPTKEQKKEAENKRRIGLGITGLGNMLQMLKLVYGSKESLQVIEKVMTIIRDTTYETSIELAKERGPFPLFDKEKYLNGEFIKTLPTNIQEGIAKYGIRNSVLLTIAPTGTTSMYYENVSSGVEPTIARVYKRKAREADGSYKEFTEVSDYGYYLFRKITGHQHGDPLPDYMCSSLEAPLVTVDQHLAVQAICQKYVDSSISKTINCPSDMSFEDFKDVYTKAYDMGCKGCTTYKPSEVRGSVISVDEKKDEPKPIQEINIEPRPEELKGSTYKIKYPGVSHAFYVTINDYIDANGRTRPFEIFVNTKSVKHQEWIVALTRMISAVFRRGGDVTFIVEELQQVFSSQGGAYVNKKYVPSIAALIGNVIEKHFYNIGILVKELSPENESDRLIEETKPTIVGEMCPTCEAPAVVKVEGCAKCTSCGYSECG